MKSFLAQLAARAQGTSEVVQPRPHALFEPDVPGSNNAVEEADRVSVEAPRRAAALPETPHAEPRFGGRVVELERLFAATPSTAHSPVAVASPLDIPSLVAVAGRPLPIEPLRLPEPPVGSPVLPPPAHAEAAPAMRPIIHLRRAEPAPGAPSPFATVPPPVAPAAQVSPSITIRIERIDVRAAMPAAPVSRPSPTRSAPGRSSLDDYLATRR